MESHRGSHARAQIIVAHRASCNCGERLAVSVAGIGRFFMRHDQTTWAWIQGGLGGSVSCFEVV